MEYILLLLLAQVERMLPSARCSYSPCQKSTGMEQYGGIHQRANPEAPHLGSVSHCELGHWDEHDDGAVAFAGVRLSIRYGGKFL